MPGANDRKRLSKRIINSNLATVEGVRKHICYISELSFFGATVSVRSGPVMSQQEILPHSNGVIAVMAS